MKTCARLCMLALILLTASTSFAETSNSSQMPTITTIPFGAQPSNHFDVDTATQAYMAEIPAAAKARSDAYFEGGYWLILWDFLYGAVVILIILHLGWSAKMRDLSERITRFKPIQTFIYWCEYITLSSILGFPLAYYEGFVREHQYGLATQTLGPWMGDQFKSLLIGIVLGGILVAALIGVIRKSAQNWWIWGSAVSFLFLIVTILFAPIYIVPIFNNVTRLDDPKVTEPILKMARANGIPAKDVFEIDASAQTNRMSANVSGIGNTMRITLNDNLLKRASPEEVQSVMGHEMGHYVMNHIYKDLMFMLILIVCEFAFLRWALKTVLFRYGQKWGIRGIADTAMIPVAALLISLLGFVLTPVMNTVTRTAEIEADIFGLNASGQPDGFAQAAIHLAEYRKMNPTPLEEFVFFDHPSGYNRIKSAMRWKAEHLERVPSHGL